MDWEAAIERNRVDLLRVVAWLFTWAKIEVGGSVATLPRFKRRTIFFVLRPSESALRRLIFVAVFVWGAVAPPVVVRAAKSKAITRLSDGERRERTTPPPFKLIDPRKNFDLHPNKPKRASGPGPQITDLWSDNPIYDRTALYAYQERMAQRRKDAEDDTISAKALCQRLNAVMAALDDLPAQAQRMASLRARMKRRFERGGKPNLPPMRPGSPPGYRRRHKHEVDTILYECHQIALQLMRDNPDTS